MSFLLAFTLLVFATGTCVLIVGMLRAPTGYEDQNGFHPTMRPVKVARPASVVVSRALPVRMHEMSGRTCSHLARGFGTRAGRACHLQRRQPHAPRVHRLSTERLGVRTHLRRTGRFLGARAEILSFFRVTHP